MNRFGAGNPVILATRPSALLCWCVASRTHPTGSIIRRSGASRDGAFSRLAPLLHEIRVKTILRHLIIRRSGTLATVDEAVRRAENREPARSREPGFPSALVPRHSSLHWCVASRTHPTCCGGGWRVAGSWEKAALLPATRYCPGGEGAVMGREIMTFVINYRG